jgi:hypothetical protein
MGTSARGIVFKKFHVMIAFRAFCFKNSPFLPVSAILPRAFHTATSEILLMNIVDENIIQVIYFSSYLRQI